jgi:hypothetical protein
VASGYIKTFRKFTEWEWYRNTNTKALFLHCLLKANHKPKKWQGIVIPPGSFVTSYATLAEELGLSMQEIRTAKRNIQSTGEITSQSTSKLTIITVLNWAKYQASDNDESTSESTSDIDETQQTSNKQTTTTKNIKNERIQEEEIKEDKTKAPQAVASSEKKVKHRFGSFKNVLLTDDENERLHKDYENADELIEYLSAYLEDNKGYKGKSHNLSIRRWVDLAVKEKKMREARVNGGSAPNGYTPYQKGNKGPDIEVPWLDTYIEESKKASDEERRKQEEELAKEESKPIDEKIHENEEFLKTLEPGSGAYKSLQRYIDNLRKEANQA